MDEDTKTLPPNVTDGPAPLRVIPKSKDPKIELLKDIAYNTIILLTVYGLIYGVVYAVSAGWHDGIRYE